MYISSANQSVISYGFIRLKCTLMEGFFLLLFFFFFTLIFLLVLETKKKEWIVLYYYCILDERGNEQRVIWVIYKYKRKRIYYVYYISLQQPVHCINCTSHTLLLCLGETPKFYGSHAPIYAIIKYTY